MNDLWLWQTGMTPLQHAAFRGRKEMVELLLANGADVNADKHENSYSTLMFAALSGISYQQWKTRESVVVSLKNVSHSVIHLYV